MVFTFGGLKVDVHSRVLSTTGTPIPGKTCGVIIGQYSDWLELYKNIADNHSSGLYCAGELSGFYYNEVSQ